MKNRLAMFCVLGLGTAVVSGISIAVVLSQSKQPKNELDAAKRHILNGVNLNEFTFTTGNLDTKNVLASKYADSPTYIKSSFQTPSGSSDFWTKQLISSVILDQATKNKEKLFGFNHPKGLLLNYFTDNYLISFNSYANDKNGTLYLKVIFKPKEGKKLNQQVEYIYKLTGFNKYSENYFKDGLFIKGIEWKKDEIKKYKTIQELKNAYDEAIKNKTISTFIENIFSFQTSPSSSINLKETKLEFNIDKNLVTLKTKLNALVNEATENDLLKIAIEPTNVDASIDKEFQNKA